MRNICFLLTVIVIFTWSCKKDSFITNPNAVLITSTDTVKFDTVFTTTGSVTRAFRIFNDNNQKLLISDIRLMGGSTSPFRLNINGMPTNHASDIEVDANDSLHVFVSVTINPNTNTTPFILRDSVEISWNGNTRFVQLQAYGQNANFVDGESISGNITWTNNLPYVILGGLTIDTNAVLTLEPGVRIYVDARSPVIIDGTLLVNGTHSSPVVFAGNRLDDPYRDFPGTWPGLIFRGSSKNNVIEFAHLKNAYQAILISGMPSGPDPKLIIRQTIIDNAYDAGLIALNTSVDISNSLIQNCGSNVVIQQGGNYNITHCTIASYSNAYLTRNRPVLSLSDYININGTVLISDLNAVLRNNIIWGDNGIVEDEILTEKAGSVFSVLLDHCIYKATNEPANVSFSSVIRNADPLFDSIDVSNRYFDFRISNPFAPGRDFGIPTPFLTDLDNNNRNVGNPDLGCYEAQ